MVNTPLTVRCAEQCESCHGLRPDFCAVQWAVTDADGELCAFGFTSAEEAAAWAREPTEKAAPLPQCRFA
jgi:hypothetical protein